MSAAHAYAFPPARREARTVWPGDILPSLGSRGPVTGIYCHNSREGQPVSLVFANGTHVTFDRNEPVYVSSPKRVRS